MWYSAVCFSHTGVYLLENIYWKGKIQTNYLLVWKPKSWHIWIEFYGLWCQKLFVNWWGSFQSIDQNQILSIFYLWNMKEIICWIVLGKYRLMSKENVIHNLVFYYSFYDFRDYGQKPDWLKIFRICLCTFFI